MTSSSSCWGFSLSTHHHRHHHQYHRNLFWKNQPLRRQQYHVLEQYPAVPQNPFVPHLSSSSSSSSSSRFLPIQWGSNNDNWEWDGDDLRFLSRLRRRFQRSMPKIGGGGVRQQQRSVRNCIVFLSLWLFVYQTVDAIRYIAQRHAAYWPQNAWDMIWDVLVANAALGPLERDLVFRGGGGGSSSSSLWLPYQPHRFLTSGFIHRGLLHFVLNMNELRRQPAWIETGLGGSLYGSTFLVSIVAGWLGHMAWGPISSPSTTVLMGCSAGICGLYGLEFISLGKMGHLQRSFRRLWSGPAVVVLYSTLLLDATSNFAHLGGFLCGVLFGLFLGPSYSRSYAFRRQWSTAVDNEPNDYRRVMGFGIKANRKGSMPLILFWCLAAALMALSPVYRTIPASILQSLWRPGSLS